MNVQIVVPFGGSDPHRTRIRKWVTDRYQRVHPGWPVTVAMCSGQWSKGRAVNPVVDSLDPDVVIVADADSYVAPGLLSEAVVNAVAHGWSYPHGKVHRICEPDTLRILDGEDVPDPKVHVRPTNTVPGGGIVVLTREAWTAVGGIDPHFIGWGGEDQALGMSLQVLVGETPAPPRTHILYHLWHPPAPDWRAPSKDTEARFQRYLAARKRPERFRDLIGE